MFLYTVCRLRNNYNNNKVPNCTFPCCCSGTKRTSYVPLVCIFHLETWIEFISKWTVFFKLHYMQKTHNQLKIQNMTLWWYHYSVMFNAVSGIKLTSCTFFYCWSGTIEMASFVPTVSIFSLKLAYSVSSGYINGQHFYYWQIILGERYTAC